MRRALLSFLLAPALAAQPAAPLAPGPVGSAAATPGVTLAAPVDLGEGFALPRERTSTAPPRVEVGRGPAEDAGSGATLTMADRSRVGVEAFWRGFALQPRLRFGGVAAGIRGLWDSPENSPPLALRLSNRWDPASRAQDLVILSLGDLNDPAMATQFERRGAAYYHELPDRDASGTYLLHRFVYCFFRGRTTRLQAMSPHVVWVEVRERLDPTEAEQRQWEARARAELEARLATLARLGGEAGVPGEEVERSRAEIQALLAEERVPWPAHMAVEEVVVSDPIDFLEPGKVVLRRYRPDQLDFYGDRVELWVSEENHRFVPGPDALTFAEECDAPWFFEPRGGRLPLVDLRFFKHPENPLAARARGEDVPELPGFLDSPWMAMGFRAAAWAFPDSFEGKPFGDPPAPAGEPGPGAGGQPDR